KILELGSGSQRIAGSIRPYFNEAQEYIGVDIEEGPGVDIVSRAQDTKFEENYFDTLAIFSLFEHDLDWKETMSHNIKWLKPGGLIFTCFGAEGNEPHMSVWQPVPHQEFLDHAKSLGLKVLDAFFEEDRYGKNCAGAYDV